MKRLYLFAIIGILLLAGVIADVTITQMNKSITIDKAIKDYATANNIKFDYTETDSGNGFVETCVYVKNESIGCRSGLAGQEEMAQKMFTEQYLRDKMNPPKAEIPSTPKVTGGELTLK